MNILRFPFLKGRNFAGEVVYTATRSSGPGGQHVNKVNTRIELRFNPDKSVLLSDTEKDIIRKKLKSITTSEGDIIVVSQSNRSQLKNKENAYGKFLFLLNKALTPRKKRIQTKATAASLQKRLETKQKHSEKKARRKEKPDSEI